MMRAESLVFSLLLKIEELIQPLFSEVRYSFASVDLKLLDPLPQRVVLVLRSPKGSRSIRNSRRRTMSRWLL